MKQTLSSFKDIERNAWLIGPGIILGIGFGLFVNGYWFIDKFPAESKQLLLITSLVSLLGAIGYFLLLGWVRTKFAALSLLQRTTLIGSSILIGAFLFFGGTDQWRSSPRYITLLLPSHSLQVSLRPTEPPGEISLVWFNTSLGDVSYDAINYRGWKKQGDQLILQNPTDNELSWKGKTGEMNQLVFQSSLRGGTAVISWDGQEETLNLSSKKNTYVHSFEVPFYASPRLVLFLGIFNFIILSLALCLLTWDRRADLVKAINQSFTRTTIKTDAMDRYLVTSAMILALLLRVFNLANLFPAVDEYYQLIAAKQIVQGAALSSVYQRSLWIVTVPVSLAMRVFGNELWAARLVGVLFNVLAILPLYFLMRKINRPIAALACLLYATSPWIITFARVVREYAYYPFYFYWILFAMVSFIEGLPDGLVLQRDWKIFFKTRMGFLGLALICPPIYGLYIDHLSTFNIVLLAYLIFGLFVLQKLSLKNRLNLLVLMLAGGGILIVAYKELSRQSGLLSLIPKFNPFPIGYFFPNPQQQWYFNRLAIIPVIGLLCTLLLCILIRRLNFIPLFLLVLYAVFLAFFVFVSKTFFHTRHLSTTELWYILLIAIGLYMVWKLLYALSSFRGSISKILLTALLGVSVLNPQQILLPVASNNPDMPISEDYYHDMSLVQAFMLGHAKQSDVLISTIYGLYATWKGEPKFQMNYRITSQTPKSDVYSIVDQNHSGWIIIDQIRLDQASLTVKDFSGKDQIEYMGLFGDQYVWHWQHSSAQSDNPGVIGKEQ
jgi:hypothetical protein